MAVDKFKFVSPGVFIDEIDESGIPALPERMGPLIIGRFEKGPSNRPIRVDSFKEFVRIFGNPSAGRSSRDTWRSDKPTAPTYAAYAAQAWLRNNTPCTIYRVLGENRDDADARATYPKSSAGWNTTKNFAAAETDLADIGGAYGLFVMPNPDSYPSGFAQTQLTVHENDKLISGVSDKIVLRATSDSTTDIEFTSIALNLTTESVVSGATWMTGSTDIITATNVAGTINTHASFSANSVGPIVHITQSFGGPLGNTQISASSPQIGFAITGSGVLAAGEGNFVSGTHHQVTGTLAAVWYVNNGAIVLTGAARDGIQHQGAGVLIKGATGTNFTAKVINSDGTTNRTVTFGFDRDSETYIRKVFNTDPTKTNGDINPSTSTDEIYWLGETFESNLRLAENGTLAVTGAFIADTADVVGTILALDGSNHAQSSIEWSDHIQKSRASQTGWFISQDTRGSTTSSFNPLADTQELFKIHALDSGNSGNNFKISVRDIKVPTDNFNEYGTFTLQVRSLHDTDANPTVLEQYTGLNLDPTSANYIKRAIGDKHYTFNSTNKTIIEHGSNENRSKLIRVEVHPVVEDGNATSYNPFGVKGPYVPKTHELNTDKNVTIIACGSGSSNCLPQEVLVQQSGQYGHLAGAMLHGLRRDDTRTAALNITASIKWPSTNLRLSSSEGNSVVGTRAYFGFQSHIFGTKRFDHTNVDLLRGQPAAMDPATTDANTKEPSWVFTLDDVKPDPNDTTGQATWASGSRADASSFTALSASGDANNKPYVLSQGYNKFTSPMFGGFDGFDITEQDPLRNSYIESSPTEKRNYAFYSLKKAIDIVSDSEYVEYDLLSAPGITHSTLNTHLVNTCEERGDALAVIDIEGGYQPPHERAGAETDSDVLGSVSSTVNNLKSLGLNSSYGCAFYPFVKIRDTINDAVLYVPPSVVALGTFSSSQRRSAVWFAPAGFTRGGLSEGSAGLPVVGVRQRLTSDDRDDLYDANINPIASFPAEGLVIFGQKTLQVTPSALDRINVRRLLIFLKKEISRIASRVLFDQNVQATWDRFTGQVVPFLEGVQAGLGLTAFKVVLDDSTTTPDLIDRNILYAKIFLKPARAIEFIALDFIVTRTGASFDD